MTRTGWDAANYARGRVGGHMSQSGLCLQFVRTCFDVPSYYASAIDAWNGAKVRHPGDRNPPMSVPLYFSTPSVYDHVVIMVDSGAIVTTFNADIRLYNGPASAAISAIERDFNGSYLGWAEDINRVTVYSGSTPTPPQEDDMTPDQASALAECQRMLGVILGYNPPANQTEATNLDNLLASGEARRMLGVWYGYNAPGSATEASAMDLYAGISENAAEARRGTGVTNAALAPAPGESTVGDQVQALVPAAERSDLSHGHILAYAITALVVGVGALVTALAEHLA